MGLRHTIISSLANGGVHPKTAQLLARHSTISLTMDRYTHTLQGQEAAALSVLPDYALPQAGGAPSAKQCRTDTTANKLASIHEVEKTPVNTVFSRGMLGIGIEPTPLSGQEPKSCASASFATRAGGAVII